MLVQVQLQLTTKNRTKKPEVGELSLENCQSSNLIPCHVSAYMLSNNAVIGDCTIRKYQYLYTCITSLIFGLSNGCVSTYR